MLQLEVWYAATLRLHVGVRKEALLRNRLIWLGNKRMHKDAYQLPSRKLCVLRLQYDPLSQHGRALQKRQSDLQFQAVDVKTCVTKK
jgi:hypothetical protein